MLRIVPSSTRPLGSGPIRTVRFGTCGNVGFAGVSMTFARQRRVVWKDRHCGCGDRCAWIRASSGHLDVCSSCVWVVHSRRVRAAQDGRRRDMAGAAPAHPRRCTWLVAVACRRRVSPHLYMTAGKGEQGPLNISFGVNCCMACPPPKCSRISRTDIELRASSIPS
jgi:hypothetical protein